MRDFRPNDFVATALHQALHKNVQGDTASLPGPHREKACRQTDAAARTEYARVGAGRRSSQTM